ncbi:hypothetical protein L1049_021754 [Liquidambar formosana]|uniref:Myb-like domain-containing protein n=1 Tax=Liquidambar formosana TaxID=63359 RepID=A0AAP0RCJ6_LIQFO
MSTSSPPPAPAPAPTTTARKVPPPCWTHDETLALIEAYRERWLSLRRGYLRSSDWDAVATAVSRRCRLVTPSKSSAQCRHKIEKLRQRYRAEKQRSLSFPGKFFSSWVFFGNLDFIDEGSTSAVGSNQDADPAGGFRVKTLADRKLVRLGFVGSKNCGNIDGISNPNADLGHDVDDGINDGGGFRPKVLGDRNSIPLGFIGSKNYGKFDGNSNPKLDFDHDIDVGSGFPLKSLGDRSSVPPGFRAKNYGKIDVNFESYLDFDHEVDDGIDAVRGVHGKTLRSSVPLRFRPKNYSGFNGNSDPNVDFDHNFEDGIDSSGGFGVKTPGNWHSVPPGFRSKNYRNIDGNSNSNLNSSILNGCSSSSRLKFAKKSGGGGGGGGVKRGMVDPIVEMVSSIRLLGEYFVKMEKMKMEMAMEIEKMRMEMEMKRNEVLLESQRQIVDAFLKAFLEKKKKVKIMVSPDS